MTTLEYRRAVVSTFALRLYQAEQHNARPYGRNQWASRPRTEESGSQENGDNPGKGRKKQQGKGKVCFKCGELDHLRNSCQNSANPQKVFEALNAPPTKQSGNAEGH